MPGDGIDAGARIMLALDPPLRELVGELRALFRETLPEAEERAQPGWGIFNYYLGGELGYIGAQKGAAVAGFTRGIELDDRAGILSRSRGAKYMRRLFLLPGETLPRDELRGLLLQAALVNLGGAPLA